LSRTLHAGNYQEQTKGGYTLDLQSMAKVLINCKGKGIITLKFTASVF